MHLIDADDFVKWIGKQKRLSKDLTVMMLQEQPTIDLEELRPKGKWVWTENGEADYEQYWVCSCCGKKDYIEENYCPNCGAKMGVEE